jgi:hypothetical protein
MEDNNLDAPTLDKFKQYTTLRNDLRKVITLEINRLVNVIGTSPWTEPVPGGDALEPTLKLMRSRNQEWISPTVASVCLARDRFLGHANSNAARVALEAISANIKMLTAIDQKSPVGPLLEATYHMVQATLELSKSPFDRVAVLSHVSLAKSFASPFIVIER